MKISKRGVSSWTLVCFLVLALIQISLTQTTSAASTYSIKGYIATDFNSSSNVKSGFLVEAVGLNISATSDANGYFELKNVPSGSSGYKLKLSKTGLLSRVISNVPVNGNVDVSTQSQPLIMWAGDFPKAGVQDDSINMSDIVTIAGCFNTVKGSAGYIEYCDINLDGTINMSDIVIISHNFNKTSNDYPIVTISSSAPTATSNSSTPTQTKATSTPTPTATKNAPTSTATSTLTPTPTKATSSPTLMPSQNTIFVAPDGNDSNDGTKEKPLFSLINAVAKAVPGATIYMRGGTYSYNTTVSITQSGVEGQRINIFAYPGEKPILNYSTQAYAAANRGINLLGNYWSLKGLEICYAGDNGIKLEGSHNIIENCVFHNNGDGGLQMGFAHTTENPDGALCAYNEIINCDSYLNFDFDNAGSDADGFACKMHNGKGNRFYGCRSWRNGDDGWDLFETDWPVEITNCWTWHNGDQADFDAIYLQKMGKRMSSYQGNGNGFKLGGNGSGGSSKGTHIVKNCVSFDNYFRSKKGFDQNSHKGGVIVYNCVSFGNGYNYMFEDSAPNEFKNNVSFACRGSLDHEFATGTIEVNNSWNLNVKAEAADFKNLTEDSAKAPRNPDGSLPDNDFSRLVSGSDLIDKGVDVGLPFKGVAPDLGAFEY
ncbi:MAG: right-handed parallel beta-helix repeat-containing protein [Bacillota bacterium]|nr:right-handed parallel beta-helix repeat-containing protein [Bacillota bacterium]